MRIAVGVMARAPSFPGKTRLAGHLSPERLRALREALLADTLLNLRPREEPPSPLATSVPASNLRPRQLTVFVEPPDAADEVRTLAEGPIECVPQVEGDLGMRMRAAFAHLLGVTQCDAAVLVGTDMPFLTQDHLSEAADALAATTGIVLGPADDGGYYLIGMRSVHAELFQAIEWGGPSVLRDTLEIADRIGIEARLIRTAYDVDTIDDLRRLEEDLRSAPPTMAPHVRAWLER